MSNDEKEYKLRDRIWESPSLLPGFDGPAAAAKEVPVRRAGSADVVVVNAEGEIAIVECKRASNPESRRSVIGQVFEYAAGLWKLDYSGFERLLKSRGTVLTEPFEGTRGWKPGPFRRAISQNLEAGDFRLFIAVDEMTETLKKRLDRTVTLLNSQLPKVRFLAVALPRDGSVEVYGEDPGPIPPLKPKLKPDRYTLIEEASSPDVAKDLLDWAEVTMKRHGVYVAYPKDRIEVIVYAPGGRLFRIKPREVRVSLSSVISSGEPWDERTEKLVQDLDDIGVRLRGNRPSARPEAQLELLADDRTRHEFLKLMKRHLGTLAG